MFLPGYDDIIALKDRILAEEKKLNESCKMILFILHSNIQVCAIPFIQCDYKKDKTTELENNYMQISRVQLMVTSWTTSVESRKDFFNDELHQIVGYAPEYCFEFHS